MSSRLGLGRGIRVVRRVRIHVETVLYGSCKIFIVAVSLMVSFYVKFSSNRTYW